MERCQIIWGSGKISDLRIYAKNFIELHLQLHNYY